MPIICNISQNLLSVYDLWRNNSVSGIIEHLIKFLTLRKIKQYLFHLNKVVLVSMRNEGIYCEKLKSWLKNEFPLNSKFKK